MTRYIKKVEQQQISGFTVLYDKREVGVGKKPWLFLADYWAMKKVHLKTGDYTIEGLEKYIAIEKKSGINELLRDLAGSYRETFIRCLERLSKYPVKCIIVESDLKSSNVDSLIHVLKKRSNGKAKLTAETIYYWTSEIMCKYGVPILFVDKGTMRKVLPFVFESAYRKAKEIKKCV